MNLLRMKLCLLCIIIAEIISILLAVVVPVNFHACSFFSFCNCHKHAVNLYLLDIFSENFSVLIKRNSCQFSCFVIYDNQFSDVKCYSPTQFAKALNKNNQKSYRPRQVVFRGDLQCKS